MKQPIEKPDVEICITPDCQNRARIKGVCYQCYNQLKKYLSRAPRGVKEAPE